MSSHEQMNETWFKKKNILCIEQKFITHLKQAKGNPRSFRGNYLGNSIKLQYYAPLVDKDDEYDKANQEKLIKYFKLNFPSLGLYYGVLVRQEDNIDHIYLVRNFVKGKALDSILDLDDYDKLVILYNVIGSLEILHSFDIQYLTLDPSKIIVNDIFDICIVDWMKAPDYFSHLKYKEFNIEGCLNYHPDIFAEIDFLYELEFKYIKFDIYSIGCMIYHVLFKSRLREGLCQALKDSNPREGIPLKEIIEFDLKNKTNLEKLNPEIAEDDPAYKSKVEVLGICQACLKGEYDSIGLLITKFKEIEEVKDFISNGKYKFDFDQSFNLT